MGNRWKRESFLEPILIRFSLRKVPACFPRAIVASLLFANNGGRWGGGVNCNCAVNTVLQYIYRHGY